MMSTNNKYSAKIGVPNIVSILLYLIPALSFANSYYVSTNGNNANLGSISAPFQTIGQAAKIVVPGDQVFVRAGTYNERVNLTRSGTSEAIIIFQSYSDEKVVVSNGFNIQASFTTVKGFEITGGITWQYDTYAMISISGSNCVVSDTNIHDVNNVAINMSGNFNIASNNRIFRAKHAGFWVDGKSNVMENNHISHIIAPSQEGGDADANGFTFFGSNHVIKNNSVVDIQYSERESGTTPHIDCYQTWGPASNIMIDGNICDLKNPSNGSYQGAMIENGAGTTSSITFKNNIFKGVYIGLNLGETDTSPDISSMIVVHNTFSNIANHPVEFKRNTNSQLINNIFYYTGSVRVLRLSDLGTFFSTNLFFQSSPMGSNSLTGDPKFLDPTNNDYHLQETSPAIDRGINAGVGYDKNGVSRPQGQGFDIGAHEYTTTSSSDTSPPVISLLGMSSLSIALGTTYVDDGATALDNFDGDISNTIIVTTNVNTSVAGTYSVTYNVKDLAGNPAVPVMRAVQVVEMPSTDTTPPVIPSDSVQITSPSDGSSVSGKVTIKVKTSLSVSWINLYIDDNFIKSSSSTASAPNFQVSLNTKNFKKGVHTLRIEGKDASGKVIGNHSIRISFY